MQLRDEEVQEAVLEELKWSPQVRPAEVGVTVKDGVVTLVGTVDNYMKKWAAEQAALRVTGVRSVANQIKVKLPSSNIRTDEDIAKEAKRILESSPDVPATVKATVASGWITLRGEVEWHYQKEEAERKLRDLTGVIGIINEIDIQPKVEPEDLKRRIEAALVRAAEIDAKNIEVEVQDSRVVLKGKVHSWYEKEEAKREAWHAPGVREVVDQLVISP